GGGRGYRGAWRRSSDVGARTGGPIGVAIAFTSAGLPLSLVAPPVQPIARVLRKHRLDDGDGGSADCTHDGDHRNGPPRCASVGQPGRRPDREGSTGAEPHRPTCSTAPAQNATSSLTRTGRCASTR